MAVLSNHMRQVEAHVVEVVAGTPAVAVDTGSLAAEVGMESLLEEGTGLEEAEAAGSIGPEGVELDHMVPHIVGGVAGTGSRRAAAAEEGNLAAEEGSPAEEGNPAGEDIGSHPGGEEVLCLVSLMYKHDDGTRSWVV